MIMKAQALVDVVENGQKHMTGEIFEVDESTMKVLLDMGWVSEVKTAPKKKTVKKGAAK